MSPPQPALRRQQQRRFWVMGFAQSANRLFQQQSI